jgi:hypothetical protein
MAFSLEIVETDPSSLLVEPSYLKKLGLFMSLRTLETHTRVEVRETKELLGPHYMKGFPTSHAILTQVEDRVLIVARHDG